MTAAIRRRRSTLVAGSAITPAACAAITSGRRAAVVVDGGVHQRADMCGLGLRSKQKPPIALGVESTALRPTAVLGCLSLPDDVLLDAGLLPELAVFGDTFHCATASTIWDWGTSVPFVSTSQ